MSCVEDLLADLDSPDRARSLFTVRAAISVARLVLSPRSLALSLMCSYCRSRLGLDPRGMEIHLLALPGRRSHRPWWASPLPGRRLPNPAVCRNLGRSGGRVLPGSHGGLPGILGGTGHR